MTDKYKVVIERKPNGEYETKLTYNGKEIDFSLSESLTEIVDHLGFEKVKILLNNSNVSKIETLIEGENLK